MKLAIIIPFYNGHRYLQRCLEGISKIPRDAIFLIDNSDDGQRLQIEAEIVTTPKSKIGFGAAVNIGLEKIYQQNRFTHVLILNQDAYFEEGQLQSFLFECGLSNDSTHDPIEKFASPMIYRDDRNEAMPFICSRYFAQGLPTESIDLKDFVAVALVAPITLMQSLNGFDESYYMYYEDNDLFARCAMAHPIRIFPQCQVRHYNPELATGKMSIEKKRWIVTSRLLFLKRHSHFSKWLFESIKHQIKAILGKD